MPSIKYLHFRCTTLLPYLLLVGLLSFSFNSCSGVSTVTTVKPTATIASSVVVSPTPTSPAAGTVLYQADLSHGVSDWQNTYGWKVTQGQLETSSSVLAMLTLPYRPTVANYAVEMRIQIARLLTDHGGYFSIFATKMTDRDGYKAEVSDLRGAAVKRPNGDHPEAIVFIDPYSSQAQGTGIPIDFEPGFEWHTYRIEVRDNEARMFVDDVSTVHASSEQTDTLSNGPIGLTCDQLILRVSKLRITAL